MRVSLAFLAASLLAGPAFAAADEPVVTASQTPLPQAAVAAPAPPPAPAGRPMTTAEQIDAFIRSAPTPEADAAGEVDGVVPRGDRKVHGVVSVGVGTGGYRSVYAQADMPLGDNGRLSLAFADTKHGRSYAYDDYDGGLGFHAGRGAFGLADRQRCDLEGMVPSRPLDVMGGPHGRCVGRVR